MVEINEEIRHRIKNASVIAVMLVVLIHAPSCLAKTGVFHWFTVLIQNRLATGAVPVFFAISGFLLAGHFVAPGWWGRELHKRVSTILIPYFIISALAFSEFAGIRLLFNTRNRLPWSSGMPNGFECLRWVGLDFAQSPEHVSLWYLRTLMFLVVLSPCIYLLAKKFRIAWLVALLAAMIALPLMDGTASPWLYGFVTQTLSPHSLFYFSVGILVRCGAFSILLRNDARVIIVALLLAVGAFAVPALSTLGCAALIWGASPSSPWPELMSRNTFSIYLFHNLALVLLGTMLHNVLAGLFGSIVQAMLSVFVSLVLAIGMRHYAPKLAGIVLGGR